ncbi:MAG: cbb3-type cytochrome c oxidase subunit I [Bacillota bacterium]|nr:MAG: cytochrome oxidase [Bacillota bacterium]
MRLTYREGAAARAFIYGGLFWMFLGMLFGLFAAVLMVWPDLIVGLPVLEYFTFGRVRPVHTNLVLFGWLTGAYFATLFYMTPRVVGGKLWSEGLGVFTALLHNLALGLTTVSLLAGGNVGREYAETPWYIKWIITATFLLVAVNLFMTVKNRTEKGELYVSAWYFLGALVTTPIIYVIGNQFLLPQNPIWGVNDAILNWFYGHNILGYWFTPVGVGAVYYLLPKLTGNPIYSHKLSMIGFWSIFWVYGPTGAHHLVNGPVPYWVQTIAIAFSVMLIIPVWTVVTNFYGTMKGKWHLVRDSVPLKFLTTAIVFYFITCFQGPMQSLRSVSAITHFTNWVVGHAHVALLGTFSFIMYAAIYYMLPRLTGRAIYSKALQEWHFHLSLWGFLLMFIDLTIAGLVQGAFWAQNQSANFIEGVAMMRPYYILRAISGAVIILGQVLFGWNVYKTATAGKPFEAGQDAGEAAPARAVEPAGA